MKIIAYKLVFMAMIMGVVSCNDFDDPDLDFSNSFPQYVELSSSSDITGAAGEEVSATIRVRENLFAPIVVGYQITGDMTDSGSATIAEGDLNVSITVTIPAAPATGTAVLELVSVDNGLTLGRTNVSTSPTSVNIVW